MDILLILTCKLKHEIFVLEVQLFIKYKDYAFRGFLPCPNPFLECQCFNLRIKEHQRDIRLKYVTQSEHNIDTKYCLIKQPQ